eukprot:5128479-Prymnesium_polylepis.2
MVPESDVLNLTSILGLFFVIGDDMWLPSDSPPDGRLSVPLTLPSQLSAGSRPGTSTCKGAAVGAAHSATRALMGSGGSGWIAADGIACRRPTLFRRRLEATRRKSACC